MYVEPGQTPPQRPEKRRQDVVVHGFHASGRWDRPTEELAKNARRLRADGRTFGTRTEVGSKEHTEALTSVKASWHVHRPDTEFGPADCAVEWDTTVWEEVRSGYQVATKIRVKTTKGFQLPPTILVYAVLRHIESGVEMLLCTTHRNLKNTPLRLAARASEARGIRKFFRKQIAKRPDRQIVFSYDENANQRIAMFRAALRVAIQRGTGLRNLWVGNLPVHGGTHGRSLLDVCLSTLPGVAFLLPDDDSSDHRPFGVTLTLP